MKSVFVYLSTMIFVAGLFIVCNISAPAQNTPDSEEYAVYARLLEQKFIGPENNQLVIRKQTMIDDFDVVTTRTKILDYSKLWAEETTADFETRNKTSATLSDKFNLNVKINFLVEEEIKEIFSANHPLSAEREGWESFRKKYPTSRWLITFSRVGFDRKRTKAFVYVTDACGPVCGEGNVYLLLKKDKTWKIEKESMLWIS